MQEMIETVEEHSSGIGRFRDEVFTKLPEDLYIPPEALEVFLDTFEGPLDLLLYIIKKHNVDILDIPVAKITEQYMQYVDIMKDIQLELAGEYLVMAAMLAEIKSRMLLPRTEEEDEESIDPRAELVRRLQEYERFKTAAENLDEIPRLERDITLAKVLPPDLKKTKPLPEVQLSELLNALKDVVKQADLQESHHIEREYLSVREKMTYVKIQTHSFLSFTNLFNYREGRTGVVVTFIAILELLKQSMIEVVQSEPFASIHIKAVNTCTTEA